MNGMYSYKWAVEVYSNAFQGRERVRGIILRSLGLSDIDVVKMIQKNDPAWSVLKRMIKKADKMVKRFPQGHWEKSDYIIFVQQLMHQAGVPRGQRLFLFDKNYQEGLTVRQKAVTL